MTEERGWSPVANVSVRAVMISIVMEGGRYFDFGEENYNWWWWCKGYKRRYRVFFYWYPPKKLKYGKPRLGESTAT